jgi:hypothetical protein
MKSAAKVWKVVVGAVLALVASAGAIWAALWARGRRIAVGAQLEELAREQFEQAKTNGKEAVDNASEKAKAGWKADQEEFLQKAKDESSTISPDDLWDRLR